jgi:oligopeptide/dipeptide ABC transporter ATP-binding protein
VSSERTNALEIRDLRLHATTLDGTADLINIPLLNLGAGEILGIVGESGSGKSLLAMTILSLLPGNVYVQSGSVMYRGEDLLALSRQEMARRIRGKRITMIFQDPMASLNPVFTIEEQFSAVIRQHNPALDARAIHRKAIEMFDLVKLSDPEVTIRKYPHELSGGMRQRVLIATALSSGAEILISDEATRSLDVTIQAGILDLLRDLAARLGFSTLFISSNIALSAAVSRRLGILYSGKLVELGPVEEILTHPDHEYTKSFLASLPTAEKKGKLLPIIPGRIPDPLHKPPGCVFSPRCPLYEKGCSAADPGLYEVSPGHFVSCFVVARKAGL